MADRAIRDFGALPTYPPSAPHSSNKIFVSERSTTAARAWNASPSSSAAPVSVTPSHHHHKARTSFPLAKFRPNLWEEGPGGEAKVERDLASWQTGWATDRSSTQRTSSGAYQTDNPYTRSASSHAVIAASASATAGGTRRDRWHGTESSFRDDYSSYASPRGGDHSTFSATAASASASASTMTEPFGEYGSVLARVTELAAQVKHLYKLNSTLESNLQTKTRQLDELRTKHETMRADPESTGAKLAQLQDLTVAHAALQASHAEATAALSELREKSAARALQIQSQDHSLAAALAQRDQLQKARELDAIELGKMSQLREEVRAVLAESARKDEARTLAEEALAQREQQLTQSEEALQARLAALATSQRLAEEAAARQAASSDPQQAQPLSAAQQAEQEKLLALQSQELERLRALAAAHEGSERKLPDDHPELTAARSSLAQLQAHNTTLGSELMAREKMIADLLASSVYRRDLIAANKEKNMTAEERARLAKKKSSVCSIM